MVYKVISANENEKKHAPKLIEKAIEAADGKVRFR